MLLDSVLDESALVADNINEDVIVDAFVECMVGIEKAHSEMMLEQAKDEFKQYVNEGTIKALDEGVVEKIKNVFAKIWAFIKKYFYKLKNFITGLHKNAYQYFSNNEVKLKESCSKVTTFYGYKGLKNYSSIETVNEKIVSAINKFQDRINPVDTKTNFTKKLNERLKALKSAICSDYESEGLTSGIKREVRGSDKETKFTYSFDELKNVIGSTTYENKFAGMGKGTQGLIKDLENHADTVARTGDENSTVKNQTKANAIVEGAKIASNACTVLSSMIKDVISQAYRFAKMAVSGKNDDERKDESADMNDAEAKAYLESIGLA